MKKTIMILLFGLFAQRVCAQQIDTAKMYTVKQVFDTINAKRTQDDKLNLSKKITALGSFVSSGDNSLKFKPTLFGIGAAFNPEHNADEYYRDHVFQRNLELDFGLTPNSSIFKYSQASFGITYAIINNAAMKKSDYEKFVHSREKDNKDYNKMLEVLARLRNDHPDWQAAIDELLESDKPDKVKIPKELDDALKAQGLPNGGKIFADADKAFDDLVAKAKTRPLLTLAPNVDYDGTKGWVKDFSAKGNVTLYTLFGKQPSKASVSLAPSYTLATDSVAKTNKLSRKIYSGNLSVDIKIDPDAKGNANWEIKPTLNYTHTDGGLYKDEKKDAWSFITKLSWKISDDFSLPLSIKVTQNKPNFLGFLSIQYSL
jgi:hypothetical protein